MITLFPIYMTTTIIFDAEIFSSNDRELSRQLEEILSDTKFASLQKIVLTESSQNTPLTIISNDNAEIFLPEKIATNQYSKLTFKKIAQKIEQKTHKILFVSANSKRLRSAKLAFFKTLRFTNISKFKEDIIPYTEPTVGDLYHQRSNSNKFLLHLHTLVFLITPAFLLMMPSSPFYYDAGDTFIAQIMSYAGFMFIIFLYYFYFFNISYLPKENKKILQYFFLPTIVNTCGVILLRGFYSLEEIVILDGTILIGATVLTMIAFFFTDKKKHVQTYEPIHIRGQFAYYLLLILLPLSVILLYTSYIGQIFSPIHEMQNVIGVVYTVISTFVLAKIQFQHTHKISISN